MGDILCHVQGLAERFVPLPVGSGGTAELRTYRDVSNAVARGGMREIAPAGGWVKGDVA